MPKRSLTKHDQRLLLEVAVSVIEYKLRRGCEPTVHAGIYPDALRASRATFVTLRRDNELRGCRGTLRPIEPLVVSVARNAHASAFYDERFSPISADEVDALDVHISILSPPEPIPFLDEASLLARVRPGVDGLILSADGHQSVFLPSVWDRLPDVERFWRHLKRKAQLPDDYWSPSVRVERFDTVSIAGHAGAIRRMPDPSELPG
ncbi:MAG: AmmeMemoRadiSam system protein A [Maioricimonas sp. JB049]